MTNLILAINIFNNSVTQRYDKTDATIEIALMLLGAAILGFLIRHFMGWHKKREIIIESDANTMPEEHLKYTPEASNLANKITSSTQLNPGDVSSKIANLQSQIDELKKEIERVSKENVCKCNNSESKEAIQADKKETTEEKIQTKSEPIIHSPAIDSVKPEVKEFINPNPEPYITVEKKESIIVDPIKPESKSPDLSDKKIEILNEIYKESTPVSDKKTSSSADDLKVIEGIGPALEKLLNEKGIVTYADMSSKSVAELEKILDDAGPRFRVHVPETWPEQAKLLHEGKLDEFKELTEVLKGGRRL